MIESLWSDEEAAQHARAGELGLRVYTSRLLGRDKSLVLHGGGNTSVKVREPNLFGEDEEILYVKGSGWDLETIEAAGFSPVRLAPARRLATLPRLSDPQMVNELRASMTRASAPTPSVEAILHAVLPFKYVDHTHADAVVTVTNTPDGEARIRAIYGDSVVVIPYVMPGFDLARLCAERFPAEAGPATIGMVLMHHGIFSFGATAREAYERMIHLVGLAEEEIAKGGAWALGPFPETTTEPDPLEIARLRRDVSQAAGFPLLLAVHGDARSLAFARREDVARVSQQGPATPDHVIRTKRLPLVGRDVDAFARAYREYFDRHNAGAAAPKTMLDPAPRVILDPALGLAAAGRTAKDAAIAAEIYEHTMDVIERAERLGGWRALSSRELFDMEYWDLEQAKLAAAGKPAMFAAMFAGEVALVTGAASGIGRAAVDALLARGAAVAGLDVDPRIEALLLRRDFLGFRCDVTVEAALTAALARTVSTFGGLDLLILNAGIFPASRKIAELSLDEWDRVLRVNLDANLVLMRLAHPLLKLAPAGGRVVVIGSKNVPAPGPGAAAYSASKAALHQLARVAALEWGKDGIRVNTLHPNAVFDTGVWTGEVLASRAAAYGLTVEEYRKNNVLGVEVTSRDVAELAAELCGPRFAKTTGAWIPVDGGNERVI